MKELNTFITEKFKISSNINNLNDILVYKAYTGDRDNPYENVFIKNTDENIEDFVMYWWRDELPFKRPQQDDISKPYNDNIRKKYKEYFNEVKEYVDKIKNTSKELSEYIGNIYEYLEKYSFKFARNMD